MAKVCWYPSMPWFRIRFSPNISQNSLRGEEPHGHCFISAVAMSLMSAAAFVGLEVIEANMLRARDTTDEGGVSRGEVPRHKSSVPPMIISGNANGR